MRRLFSMMANQVQSTAAALRHWWSTLSPDPSTWVPFTWVLAALVLFVLLVLILRPRRPAAGRRPELLISHGELRFGGAPDRVASSLHAPADGSFALSMTVSNLSAVPVQLLELAVRTNGSTAPTTAEVPAVLPPHGAVEVSAELREAGGDEGTLELFVYVPDMPPKTFRVRARLLWEPWNARFRVLPLDQKVEPARRLAERGLQRREAARRSPARAPGRRAAADRRAYEARFPGVELENEVRFEPRPESARPRASWPGESRTSAAFPPAPDPRRAPASGRAAGTGPSGGPDEGWVVESDGGPSDSGDESVTIWPPRRTRTPSSASPGSSEEGTGRPRVGRGSRSERLFAEAPIAEDRPDDLLVDDLLVEEGPGSVRDRGSPAGDRAERGESEMQPWEARQRAERRREAQRREAERAAAERAGGPGAKDARTGDARTGDARTGDARTEADRREAERLASLRREGLRRERERREQARREAERVETERREQERLKAERLDADRREAERLASERREAERREMERSETGPSETQRPDARQRETERLEAQRAREARAARQRAAESHDAERGRGQERSARSASEGPGPTASGTGRPADLPVSPDDAPRTERGGRAPSQERSTRPEGGGEAPAGGRDGPRPGRSDDGAAPEKDEAPRPRLEFPDEF